MGFANQCSNRDERYTCPACYTDLPRSSATYAECGSCGAQLHLTVEYVPEYTATVVDPLDIEDDEDADA